MNETLKNSLIMIVFFFVALFLYSKIAGPISFSVNNVNTENASPFQTTGTGEVKGTPDQVSVSLGVTANSNTADDARAKANEVINKVTKNLKALGIKETDIKTTNFSVYPNNPSQIEPMMAPSDSTTIIPIRQTATGFTASANIEVKTNSVELANKAIDSASSDGSNVIGGVNFTFDDKTKESLENQARNLAVADAKKKAEALASAAGIKLGRVINISESGSGFPIPMMAAKSADSLTQTNLNPGENTVSVTVTLTFETN